MQSEIIVLSFADWGRPEIRLRSNYNLLCGQGWTHSVPFCLAVEGTLQIASRSLSARYKRGAHVGVVPLLEPVRVRK